MNIVVPIKFVPDLVEELTIDDIGTVLDTAWLRMILNEFDDYAIEQAILLKEAAPWVTVVARIRKGSTMHCTLPPPRRPIGRSKSPGISRPASSAATRCPCLRRRGQDIAA